MKNSWRQTYIRKVNFNIRTIIRSWSNVLSVRIRAEKILVKPHEFIKGHLVTYVSFILTQHCLKIQILRVFWLPTDQSMYDYS